MVRLVAAISLFCSSAFGEGALRFAVEYSKAKVFQGEVLQAQFVLYSTYDRVEVEVAKFPEFRGFWTENTALRQGPLMMMQDSRLGMRRAVIGAYNLTPMLGTQSVVTPMRVLVRTFSAAGADETVIDSEPAPLTVLPLPPVPPKLKPLFVGGVGMFTLRVENPVVRFYVKEPTAIRFQLSGNGNFPEINRLPIQWPSGVKVISMKSSTFGTGAFQTKTFEWIVTLDQEEPLVIPPLSFAYFSPLNGIYQIAASDEVRLEPMQRPPEESTPAPIELAEEREWTAASALTDRSWFVALQILLGGIWLALFGHFAYRKAATHRAQSPWGKLRLRWKLLFQELTADSLQWFQAAEALVFDTTQAHFRKKDPTRKEAIRKVEKYWGKDAAASANRLFSTWELLRFSPNPPPPPSPSEWKSELVALKKTLFRRPRSIPRRERS